MKSLKQMMSELEATDAAHKQIEKQKEDNAKKQVKALASQIMAVIDEAKQEILPSSVQIDVGESDFGWWRQFRWDYQVTERGSRCDGYRWKVAGVGIFFEITEGGGDPELIIRIVGEKEFITRVVDMEIIRTAFATALFKPKVQSSLPWHEPRELTL